METCSFANRRSGGPLPFGRGGKLHVLFVQVSRDSNPEYSVHRLLGDHAAELGVKSTFFWQRSQNWNEHSRGAEAGRDRFFEFGRDLSLRPRPSRWARLAMMLRHWPFSLPELIGAAKELRPDLVYVSQQVHDVRIARLINRLLGIPVIVHVHYPASPALGLGILAALRKFPILISCSEFVRQTLTAHGVSADTVTVIHNAVDSARNAPPRAAGNFRAELGIPSEAPLIVCAGRLDPNKRQDTAIKAFLRVRDRFPMARLAICGEAFDQSGYDRTLRQIADESGAGQQILFLGHRPDLADILADARIFCLPAVDEAFGLVFIEAMAAGLPVLACRSGAAPEIIVDGETGLLSEPDDAEALAGNLARLLSDSDFARRLGDAGRRRALDQFAPAPIARRWADHLLSAIGRNGSRTAAAQRHTVNQRQGNPT